MQRTNFGKAYLLLQLNIATLYYAACRVVSLSMGRTFFSKFALQIHTRRLLTKNSPLLV
jgi:hypothetical protein